MSQRLKILNIVGARPNLSKIFAAARDALAGTGKAEQIPALRDGPAAKWIVEILLRVVSRGNAS